MEAGLHEAKGDAIVIIDVDLQDTPLLILEMVHHYEAGFHIVNAQRISRTGETFLKK